MLFLCCVCLVLLLVFKQLQRSFHQIWVIYSIHFLIKLIDWWKLYIEQILLVLLCEKRQVFKTLTQYFFSMVIWPISDLFLFQYYKFYIYNRNLYEPMSGVYILFMFLFVSLYVCFHFVCWFVCWLPFFLVYRSDVQKLPLVECFEFIHKEYKPGFVRFKVSSSVDS